MENCVGKGLKSKTEGKATLLFQAGLQHAIFTLF